MIANAQNNMTFEFIEDSGHAWLKVPYQLLETLNLNHKISEFSFRNKEWAWLEEDCDAPLLINTLNNLNISLTFNKVYVKDRTKYFSRHSSVFRFS